MPGVDLNLDLPSLADNMSDIVSKLVTALSVVETDLADKVTSSELDINTSLSVNGNRLTNLGAVQFVAGSAPTAAGSMWFDTDGEFYLRDSTGALKVTAGGALNVAAAGTIGGDYGGANPATVTFDDASGEYRFKEDTAIWADGVFDDVVLQGASGSVRLGCDATVTFGRQIQIALPSSGLVGLTYDTATSKLGDTSDGTTITGTAKFTNISIAGAFQHATRSFSQGLDGVSVTAGSLSGSAASDIAFWSSASTSTFYVPLHLPAVGGETKITSIDVEMETNTLPTLSLLYQNQHPPTFTAITGTTANVSAGGFTKITYTPVLPTTLGAGVYAVLKFITGAVVNKFYNITIRYTSP